MNKNYEAVSRRANYLCEYCRAPESAFNFPFEVDHFIPLSRNGSDDLDNLVLACRSCNAYKAFHYLGLSNTTKEIRLFNPRKDAWNEHFQINLKTLEIKGLTEVGNGTIKRLKMNNTRQLKSRKLWKKFEIFP